MTLNLSKGRLKQLSPRERRFLRSYLGDGKRIVEAYKDCVRLADGTVPVSDATARVTGSNMLARLRRNPPLWQEILAAAEIDDMALAGHIARMLRARKTEFYQGQAVAEVEDNGTQMRAVELLADVLGKRKASVDVNGALALMGGIRVVLDDDVPADAPTDAGVEAPARPGETRPAEGRGTVGEELRGESGNPAPGADVPGEPAPGGEV